MSRTCFPIANFAGTQLCPKASHPQSCTNTGAARATHPTLDLRDTGKPPQLLLPHLPPSSSLASPFPAPALIRSLQARGSPGGVGKLCLCFSLFGSVSHPENIRIYQLLFLLCLYTCTPHMCSYDIEGIHEGCERSFPLPSCLVCQHFPASLPSTVCLHCTSQRPRGYVTKNNDMWLTDRTVQGGRKRSAVGRGYQAGEILRAFKCHGAC